MKILQIIQRKQLRGAEIFASQLSEKLNERGCISDLVYLFNGSSCVLDSANYYIPLEGYPSRRFYDFEAYHRLTKIIREGRYDLVQANAGDTLKYAALSKYLHRWKQPLVFRNANYISGFINTQLKRSMNALWMRKCDHVISVSESCRRDFVNLFPSHHHSSTTITIGTKLWDGVLPATIREELGIGDEPVFINVGSLVPEKNHAFLIDLFHAYIKQEQKGHVLLVGDGPLRTSLEEKVKGLGIQPRVHFLGYRNDVTGLLKASDMMVMPSKIEGLPGVILEALACRLPVIASNVGGINEVIEDGINGYCLDDFSELTYLVAIENVLSNLDLMNEFKTNGRKTVESKFTLDKISSQFIATYKQILNTSP